MQHELMKHLVPADPRRLRLAAYVSNLQLGARGALGSWCLGLVNLAMALEA